MITLNLNIDLEIDEIDPKYLKYVDWDKVMITTPVSTEVLKHLPIPKLTKLFSTQEQSGLSDEDVLSMIARDIYNRKSTFSLDIYIIRIVTKFCPPSFIEKYYRQIMFMFSVNDRPIDRIKSTIAMLGIIEPENLIGLSMNHCDWDVINSPRVSYELRRKLTKSRSFLSYQRDYNLELPELCIALKNDDIEKLFEYRVNDFKQDVIYPIVGLSHSLLQNREVISWDELVEAYLTYQVSYDTLQGFWEEFVNRNFDDYDELARALYEFQHVGSNQWIGDDFK